HQMYIFINTSGIDINKTKDLEFKAENFASLITDRYGRPNCIIHNHTVSNQVIFNVMVRHFKYNLFGAPPMPKIKNEEVLRFISKLPDEPGVSIMLVDSSFMRYAGRMPYDTPWSNFTACAGSRKMESFLLDLHPGVFYNTGSPCLRVAGKLLELYNWVCDHLGFIMYTRHSSGIPECGVIRTTSPGRLKTFQVDIRSDARII